MHTYGLIYLKIHFFIDKPVFNVFVNVKSFSLINILIFLSVLLINQQNL